MPVTVVKRGNIFNGHNSATLMPYARPLYYQYFLTDFKPGLQFTFHI